MKNKKIAILLLSIIFTFVLGVYYAQPFLADPQKSSFNFKVVEGNLNEIENLHYTTAVENDGSMSLDISPEGTKRLDSVLLGSIYTYQSSDMKRWQNEYRTFMRKKQYSYNNFTEEEDDLFYTNDYSRNWSKDGENKVAIQIEKLDKATKEVTTKEINIESLDEIEFISYHNISKAGPYLAIQAYVNTAQTQKYNTYIYNWETGEIVDEIQASDSFDYWSGDTTLYIEVLDTENPKFLLNKRSYLYEEVAGQEWQDEKIENDYQIYNPETKDTEKIFLPYELTDNHIRYVVGDGNVIFVEKSEEHFQVTIYDVENQKLINEKIIPIQSNTFSEEPYFHIVKQDSKLLITQTYMESEHSTIGIVVVNLDRFEKNFEGTMGLTDQSKEELKDREIYFDSIYFD
ncbi:hypothetical protein LZ578_05190 [Jeotgalibaca sp. MA1X17-3]|uniref:hypothetical protein n=1 Tax=Jeotgalibaca sp. MA1X17-3 TaxID=2908211 RepID=UPI001F2357A5|nr:hypothetical protein [Jeotgalibaca sp. MA1X17-3]UJF16500.1 hypothetical protein LZ578_05190 [Jeotgalibaca sp. MA1X17-3]